MHVRSVDDDGMVLPGNVRKAPPPAHPQPLTHEQERHIEAVAYVEEQLQTKLLARAMAEPGQIGYVSWVTHQLRAEEPVDLALQFYHLPDAGLEERRAHLVRSAVRKELEDEANSHREAEFAYREFRIRHEIEAERAALLRENRSRLEPMVAERLARAQTPHPGGGHGLWVDDGAGVSFNGTRHRADILVRLGPFNVEQLHRDFGFAWGVKLVVTDQDKVTVTQRAALDHYDIRLVPIGAGWDAQQTEEPTVPVE